MRSSKASAPSSRTSGTCGGLLRDDVRDVDTVEERCDDGRYSLFEGLHPLVSVPGLYASAHENVLSRSRRFSNRT